MTDHKNAADHPDLWLSETTTPGLVLQTDVNNPGQPEALFAGKAAPSEALPLPDAEGAEMVQPFEEFRANTSIVSLHDFLFMTRNVSQVERENRLEVLARELELCAAHVRRLLTEAQDV